MDNTIAHLAKAVQLKVEISYEDALIIGSMMERCVQRGYKKGWEDGLMHAEKAVDAYFDAVGEVTGWK